MGDFNAKIGQEKVGDIMGSQGLQHIYTWRRMIEQCLSNIMMIGNTWTWKNPGDGTRNQ